MALARVSSSSRSYDLQDRRRTGNMTGTEQARYKRIPTDESEAQTLASSDLDGIKSECTPNYNKDYFYFHFSQNSRMDFDETIILSAFRVVFVKIIYILLLVMAFNNL